MLRKATEEDMSALVALRCKAAGTNRADAAGWLQNVAGLENILVLEKAASLPQQCWPPYRSSTASITASGFAGRRGHRACRWTACCPN